MIKIKKLNSYDQRNEPSTSGAVSPLKLNSTQLSHNIDMRNENL
jgi:hypothetical protein